MARLRDASVSIRLLVFLKTFSPFAVTRRSLSICGTAQPFWCSISPSVISSSVSLVCLSSSLFTIMDISLKQIYFAGIYKFIHILGDKKKGKYYSDKIENWNCNSSCKWCQHAICFVAEKKSKTFGHYSILSLVGNIRLTPLISGVYP